MQLLKWLLFTAHFVISAILIVLVMLQTHRSEGLGTVGGDTAGPMRGRMGLEEQLTRWTAWAAGAFMVLSALLFIAVRE